MDETSAHDFLPFGPFLSSYVKSVAVSERIDIVQVIYVRIISRWERGRRMVTRTTSMGGWLGGGGLLVASLALASCASINGGPDRITASDVSKLALICPSAADLTGRPSTESDGSYRDRIVLKCVTVINAKFAAYEKGLSVDSTTTELVTDLGAQALSGVAAVATSARAAAKLSAGSAFLLGVNGAVSKDLFYKQTLPAIAASMEARRTKVLTDIIQAQVKDPDAKVYTLARAGFDISRYEDAGNMLSAIRELTASANQNATDAAASLKAAQMNLDIGTVNLSTPPEIKARVNSAIASVRAQATKAGSENKLRAILTSLKASTFHDLTIPDNQESPSTLSAVLRSTIMEVESADTAKQAGMMDQIEAALKANEGN